MSDTSLLLNILAIGAIVVVLGWIVMLWIQGR